MNRNVGTVRDRTNVSVHNLSTNTVYWGSDVTVTTSTGFPLRAGANTTFARIFGDDPRLAVFFIGTGTDTIAISESITKNGEGEK